MKKFIFLALLFTVGMAEETTISGELLCSKDKLKVEISVVEDNIFSKNEVVYKSAVITLDETPFEFHVKADLDLDPFFGSGFFITVQHDCTQKGVWKTEKLHLDVFKSEKKNEVLIIDLEEGDLFNDIF